MSATVHSGVPGGAAFLARPSAARPHSACFHSTFSVAPVAHTRLSRPSVAVQASRETSDDGFDGLWQLVPSPGRKLAAYDLMFSTDGEGRSDPNQLRQYIKEHSDGPPRFASPILSDAGDEQERRALPLMLYLPGLDGSGICAARQYPLLLKSFDLRKLVIPLKDRTPFQRLVKIVEDYILRETEGHERPVYILGESFGGILSLAVAAELGEKVDRVVLVNPATSFPRSIWPSFGPVLSQLPPQLYNAAPFALVPLLGDPLKMASFYTPLSAAPPEQAEYLAQGLVNMLPLLGMLSDLLPSDTLEWKIDILGKGAQYTEGKMWQVRQPVLVIAGDADMLVPSAEESIRLREILPLCSRRVLAGHSHLLMQEQGVDIAQIIKEEGFLMTSKTAPPPPLAKGQSERVVDAPAPALGWACPLSGERT